MRASLFVAALLAAVTALQDNAMGYPGMGGGSTTAKPATGPATTQPTSTVKGRYERVLSELKLPPEKAAAAKKILDDNYKELMEWVAKVDPEVVKLRAQMRSVHGASDPKTLEQAQAALTRYRQLQLEMAQKVALAFEPLSKVLTPEQLATAKSILLPQPKPASQNQGPMGGNPFHLLVKVGLTNEQISRISEIMDEARAAKEKDKSPTAPDYEAKAWQRIIKEVLTDKQRADLEAARAEASHRRMALAILSGLELTKEQMDKVDTIWKAAYDEAAKKPEKRMDIYADAQDKIVNEVLTEAQRKQLKENRSGAPHPMPPGM